MSDELKHFDYFTHYKIDATEFDYFEERIGPAKHEERRLREIIISQIQKESKIILDVGCGSGWVAEKLSSRGKKIISLDISKLNPQRAKNHFPDENHHPLVADSFHLPFKNNSLDCVIAAEIIEHVINPKNFINELFRVIKEGGRLIISTPYKEKIKYYLCIHCNKKSPVNAHLHSFDENILRNLYKGEELKHFYFMIFGNKALIYLRTHILLKYLPLILWRLIDWFANKIYKKPLHIICVYEKKN